MGKEHEMLKTTINPGDKFKYLNMLIHGQSGIGKSTLVSSLCRDPRTTPVLVLDCDKGTGLRFVDEDPRMYTIIECEDIDKLSSIYNYLTVGKHPYKSVAVDNITALQKQGLWRFTYGSNPTYASTKNWVDLKQAEIKHWGQSLSQMILIVQAFCDLKMHVVFTALSQRNKNEITQKEEITVKLPGQQADEIPSIPDIVGHIKILKTKEGLERVLQVQPDGVIDCKDRTDALGVGVKFVKDGTVITKILDTIYQKYNIPSSNNTVKSLEGR